MAETASIISILAASSAIVLGLLRFLTWFARSSNADYQALSKTLLQEREEKQKVVAERDMLKLKMMMASEQREDAVRVAIHWRDKYKQVTMQPPIAPPTEQLDADSSQITTFNLNYMRAEIEDSTLLRLTENPPFAP